MIQIVRAEEGHISDIGRLWLEFIRFHADIEPIFEPREGAVAGFEEEQARRIMNSEDGLALVALDNGRVVGYSLAEILPPAKGYKLERHGYIHDVAVTSSYRYQGIGEKMYSEIIEWFQSKNIERVELEITSKNRVAASFWKKQGLTEYIRRLYRQI